MRISPVFPMLAGIVILSLQCSKDNDPNDGIFPDPDVTAVAGHTVALETVLRSIPEEYLVLARNNLHVSYQHTSHGTHVSYGLYGLPGYKQGDNERFGITRNNPEPGKLDFRDNLMAAYAPDGIDASDLSRDETAFIQTTRNYLDAPENEDINVIMWAWCDIAGHDIETNYLPGMEVLISEYGPGGSRIGHGEGQRSEPVTFVFMTGHGNANDNIGEGRPAAQAAIITSWCETRGYFCLDYFDIDSHCMNHNYWEDAGDNGNSASYGGNFYLDWQEEHEPGTDYFFNRESPDGEVTFGQHNTQHITANRKAYAMWYILARIAGWNGQ